MRPKLCVAYLFRCLDKDHDGFLNYQNCCLTLRPARMSTDAAFNQSHFASLATRVGATQSEDRPGALFCANEAVFWSQCLLSLHVSPAPQKEAVRDQANTYVRTPTPLERISSLVRGPKWAAGTRTRSVDYDQRGYHVWKRRVWPTWSFAPRTVRWWSAGQDTDWRLCPKGCQNRTGGCLGLDKRCLGTATGARNVWMPRRVGIAKFVSTIFARTAFNRRVPCSCRGKLEAHLEISQLRAIKLNVHDGRAVRACGPISLPFFPAWGKSGPAERNGRWVRTWFTATEQEQYFSRRITNTAPHCRHWLWEGM